MNIKYLMLTMLESLNYSFRKPKNIIWVIYRIKELRNYKKKKHGVLRGPQLDKQRWRARLGILRVKYAVNPNIMKKILININGAFLRNISSYALQLSLYFCYHGISAVRVCRDLMALMEFSTTLFRKILVKSLENKTHLNSVRTSQ